VNLDPDRANGDVGQPLEHLVQQLRDAPPTPSARMFACREHACMDSNFYATAWAIFAYLANTHPQELLRYAQRLDELPPDPAAQEQAWSEVFPALTPDKLDHEVRSWLAYGRHTVWRFNIKLQDWPVTERPLRDADVLAARAAMRQVFANPSDAPAPELAGALAAEPTNLLANLVKSGYKQPISAAEAHAVADAHADDWRAWWLLGYSADWHGDDGRTAWEKACALVAQHPTAAVPPRWCEPLATRGTDR